MRIVDETFPSDGGAGFFKVRPHHDQESIAQRIGDGLQFGGVFVRSFRVMDGTGSDNDEEPLTILPMENPADGFSGFNHQGGSLVGNREFGLNLAW